MWNECIQLIKTKPFAQSKKKATNYWTSQIKSMSIYQNCNNKCNVRFTHRFVRIGLRNLGVVRISTWIFWHFFSSSVHGARVLCFIERVLRSHSVAICWSAIVLLWGREERSWCEFVSGLKMSTICFSYNSFQLLFLLLEVFCLRCRRTRSILGYRFTKDTIILKSTLTFHVFFFFS